MALQVSSPVSQTLGNVMYSPNSRFLVSSVGNRANVLDAVSLETLHVFSCVDKIEKLEISPDSCYILCALISRGIVQCFSLEDSTWRCRINESVAGITTVKWCPDSRHIAVESDFGIQLAIWSLVDNSSYIVSSPKAGVGCVFSDCGRFMAIAHRLECKDYIGVYSTGPWMELVKFRCMTNDLASITWTASGAHLIVADSHLSYKLFIYSASGEVIHEYEAYQNALGIRCIAMHKHPIDVVLPSGADCDSVSAEADDAPHSTATLSQAPHPLLAVGSYDGNVRLLSTRSWAVAYLLPSTHPSEMVGAANRAVLPTVEIAGDVSSDETAVSDVFSFSSRPNVSRPGTKTFIPEDKYGSAYVTKSLKNLPQVPADPHAKGGLRLGVNWAGWSGDGQLLAVRAENFPRCLWIWNGLDGELGALLVQLSAVTCARWRPYQAGRPHLKPMLAFCTNVSRVYFWTPVGTSWVDIPGAADATDADISGLTSQKKESTAVGAITGSENGKMLVASLKWSADGRKLILMGKGSFCTCDISDGAMMGGEEEVL